MVGPIAISDRSGVCEWQAVELGMSGISPKHGNKQPHQTGEPRQPAGIQLHAQPLRLIACSWWLAELSDLPFTLATLKA